MDGVRVETCTNCGKDFWAGPKDNGICFSCFYEMRTETEPVRIPERVFQPQPVKEARVEQPPGYVYLMKSSGWHKIGMTSRKSGRLNELRNLFPVIKLIHKIACRDAGAVEMYLHQKYRKQRVRREWYKLTKEDVAWFRSLSDHDLDDIAARNP